MRKAKVISAFPASGKTFYFEHREENDIVLDSDSSEFSWCYDYNTLKSIPTSFKAFLTTSWLLTKI
jgi:hypothetical protein